MKNKGTGAENLIWLASRQSGRADPSSLAADDILAALTGRLAELEARVSAILAEFDPKPPRVDSEPGRALRGPTADLGSTDKMSRDARVEVDDELTRASEERRMLANEMRLLREAFQETRRSQLSAGAGAKAIEGQIAPELRSAIADEMRSLLTELLADFRARAAPPPPTAAVAETTEAAVVLPQVSEQLVEDVDTVAPVVDRAAAIEAPIETVESVIEPIDEFVRPTVTEPIVDEYVEDLRASEPIAPTDALEVWAAPPEPATPIVDDHVEQLRAIETVVPIDAVEVEAAPPEPAQPSVDEHVFQPVEPAAPIVDEYVEELRQPEPPSWIETIELSQTPAEPIIDEPEVTPIETVEMSAPRAEPIEPIVDDYVVPASDVTTTPSAPTPPPDARIAALWEAASSPMTEAETAPLSPPEPAPSFITQEFIAATRSLEIPEEPYPAQEFPLGQTIELAPPPPVELAAPAPVEYTPEPPAISEPAAAGYSQPLPEANTPSWASPFPELSVADDRGLHQIQIVISPIHSFPRLLDTQARIRALSTVNAVHLRDFRNGIATFAVAVSEAISPAEFGAVIQMLQDLHLRLEGTTQTTVELRAEDEPPPS